MSPSDRSLWIRIGAVASALWLGLILIISTLARDFEWFPHSYMDAYASHLEIGPAFYVAVIGAGMIWAVCLGLPWIFDRDV